MKKKTKDAVKILRHMFVDGDPQAKKILEEINAEDEIARKIYKLRTLAGLTQKELAELVGTQPSAISRLEDADYDGHSLSMLRRIAEALNQKLEISFVPIEGEEAA